MQATMNAPRTGFPSHQAQAPTRALPAAPQQKAAPSPEQLQQAAHKLVHAYANAVVEGLYKIIIAEADKCEKQGTTQNILKITMHGEGGKQLNKTIQPASLQSSYADNNVDVSLNNLSLRDRLVFKLVLSKSEELMSEQCKFALKCVQAYVTKTLSADTAQKTSVLQSCIFKTQVLLGVNKIPEQHKIIIQSLSK